MRWFTHMLFLQTEVSFGYIWGVVIGTLSYNFILTTTYVERRTQWMAFRNFCVTIYSFYLRTVKAVVVRLPIRKSWCRFSSFTADTHKICWMNVNGCGCTKMGKMKLLWWDCVKLKPQALKDWRLCSNKAIRAERHTRRRQTTRAADHMLYARFA